MGRRGGAPGAGNASWCRLVPPLAMRSALALLCALPLLAVLPACAADTLGGSPQLREVADRELVQFVGVSEMAVRERLGEPYDLRETADGTRWLRYVGLAIGRYGVPARSRVVVFRVVDGVVEEVATGSFL